MSLNDTLGQASAESSYHLTSSSHSRSRVENLIHIGTLERNSGNPNFCPKTSSGLLLHCLHMGDPLMPRLT
jgi:hypothetical protein